MLLTYAVGMCLRCMLAPGSACEGGQCVADRPVLCHRECSSSLQQRLQRRLCLLPLPRHRVRLLMLVLCLQVAMARQMQLQEQRMKQAREREYNVAFDQYMDHERQQVRGASYKCSSWHCAKDWPHLAGCGHGG